jgi:hypothetical protein
MNTGIQAAGKGGNSFFGGAMQPAIIGNGPAAMDGRPGVRGCGGSGAASGGAGFNALGGLGGDGFCVVTEYCWADGSEQDCCNPNSLDVNARVAVTQVPWCPPGPPGCGPAPAGFSGGPRGYGFDE